MSVLKRVATLVTLLVVSSCATKTPLRVGVGTIEGGRIYFSYGDGVTDMLPVISCERGECVVIKIEEFEQLLKRCKMKR